MSTVSDKLQCSSCKKWKPATSEYFHVDNTAPRGYTYACKECRNNKYLYGEENKRKRAEIARKWRKESPTHLLARRKRRIHAIVMLGGKCECCGERNLEFLAIDHINGLSHRTTRDSGDNLIKQVSDSGFDRTKFRVLCHNCNSSIGFYGYCPHRGHSQEFLTRKRFR